MPQTRKSWWWIALALVLVGTATLGHYAQPARAQTPRVTVEFWHGLAMPLGGILEKIATDFNESQTQYQVNPTFKGSYPETMVAAIAAFRAGNAPHIVQMFEVGTATMMSARGAIKPVHELMREAGVAFDPAAYLPAVAGYYSLPDGRMMAMPFNSSTTIMFYNKDAFKKAGLDPNKPPQTWTELRDAAKKIRATNAAPCGFTTAWPTWAQFEQFSAIHNVPLATKANGLGGLDAELKINSPLHVRHVQTLVDMQKEGSFKYGGRDAAGDALFPSGECAIIHASSGLRARIAREAKFEWGATMLPYYPGTPGRAQELDHRRRRLLGDDLAEPQAGGVQGGGRVLPLHQPPGGGGQVAYRHRLPPHHLRGLRAGEGLRLLPAESRHRHPVPPDDPDRDHRELDGACGSATCRRSGTSSRRSWRRRSRGSSRRSRRSTARCSGGTRSCATSSGRTARSRERQRGR